MFDIWLKTSSQIVQEIIDESDLKTIVSQKINNFKKSPEFQNWLNNQIKLKMQNTIAEMIDNDIIENIENDIANNLNSTNTNDDLFVPQGQLFYLPTDKQRFAVFAADQDVVQIDGIAIESKSKPLFVYNEQIDALEYCVMNKKHETSTFNNDWTAVHDND